MDAATLHDAIDDVCPIVSVSVGDADDRSTWSFVPAENATQAQIGAGQNVINTIPIDPLSSVPTGDFIARFTNAEYALLQQKRVAGNPGAKVAKDWDNCTSDPQINMNKKKVQTLKSDLVPDVLTQVRADEIFS